MCHMGIGGGIFLIAVGLMLVLAVDAGDAVNWLDLDVAGSILVLAGIAVVPSYRVSIFASRTYCSSG